MYSFNTRRVSFSIVYCLITLVGVMFLITVILLFILLLQPNYCNCSNDEVRWQMNNAKSPHKLAVLVPFRERFDELLIFVPYINKFLDKQNIDHHIFILNQVDSYRFNRASLINVGYLFTKKKFDYIAMHDVDLLPLNDALSYSYPRKQPHHVAAPNLHPRYHYEKFVGGILLITMEHFGLVNGMSNKYWGWGLEDDEFYVRLREANLLISRPIGIQTGTNNTFKHIHDKNRRKRDTIKCHNQREITRKRDRQTGVHDVNYTIQSVMELRVENVPITVVNIYLTCNFELTPWCACTENSKAAIKHKSL